MSKVIIVGGGAAGMMASVIAAKEHEVILIEKNEKLGKKLFITGKGRCNFTNECPKDELFQSVINNPKFMYSAFNNFTNEDTIYFFNELGLKSKTERGGRVFPASDKSSDVIKALEKKLKSLGVKVMLNTAVTDILISDGRCTGVKTKDETIYADEVIIATGGASYPLTGSTGDGYTFAKKAGHNVTDIRPGLAPLRTKEDFPKRMQGLSLRNVAVRFSDTDGKKVHEDFGELLFTHFGVSGPVILTAESFLSKRLAKEKMTLTIDFKPALDFEKLDARMIRELEESPKRSFRSVLKTLLPASAVPVFEDILKIDPEKKACEVTSANRKDTVRLLKGFNLTITGTGGLDEAIITQGGVDVKEIDPRTMESKLCEGLYFIGEVLDTDALTGGFNLQIAWSSAYVCAKKIGEK